MRDIRFLLKTHYVESRALVIGINKYRKAPPLGYAVSDATELRQTLVDELDFPVSNIITLIDEEATRENIVRSFLSFTSDDIGLDDRIIVFFAGHGTTRTGARGEVGYLVPVDADIDDLSTLIRWDDLTRNADLIRAKHVLFVMDACYGGLAFTRGLHAGSARFLKDMLLRYSRQVLTAGKADEVVADAGGPIPNHSVFTGHLLEGLRGAASTPQGIITASGLMSYVYGKVATDKNSNQTPHYGHIDGDGDFVLIAPQLVDLERSEQKGFDSLMVIPYAEADQTRGTLESKIKQVKDLLASQEHSIHLHDFVVDEVKRFLSASSDDHFKVQGTFSIEELLSRISKYEEVTKDLSVLTACIAYWATSSHRQILRKVLTRSTDRLERTNGLTIWISLRWYPVLLQMYCAGIAAVEAKRYDSLADIFLTPIETPDSNRQRECFVESASNAVLEFSRVELFKNLPGHERHYTPMSEYLFKLLQPQLDDALFIGKNYESTFDEFEILFALVSADLRKQQDRGVWGPIGRFGWKHHRSDNSPLQRVIAQAKNAGKHWEPLQNGLFGGDLDRFQSVADEYAAQVVRLNWW